MSVIYDRVALIGLGLIAGSMAHAIRENALAREVTGYARSAETRDIARSADDNQPFSALAFKIMNDPFVGSLTFTRIYSGQLKKGDQMLNATKGKRERVGRMMMMHSINR